MCCHSIFGPPSSFQSRILFDCSQCAMFAAACMIACVDVLMYGCVLHHRIVLVSQLSPLYYNVHSSGVPTARICPLQCTLQCIQPLPHIMYPHTMHTVMNWSPHVTSMSFAGSFQWCVNCDAWLQLPASCNDVCDAVCVMLQVHVAVNPMHWLLCMCSWTLST